MQIHTTGMDIPQYYSARACVTLGKDMTWRDLAQVTSLTFDQPSSTTLWPRSFRIGFRAIY